MKVLGCDCSTKSIGCVMLDSKSDEYFCCSLLESKEKDTIVRSEELFFLFKGLLEAWVPDIVYIEQAVYCNNIKTTLTIDSVVNGIKYNCILANIPYQIIDNKSWKKQVLGNGKASKEDIMKFAKIRFPGKIYNNQDLADSSLISLFGIMRMS